MHRYYIRPEQTVLNMGHAEQAQWHRTQLWGIRWHHGHEGNIATKLHQVCAGQIVLL